MTIEENLTSEASAELRELMPDDMPRAPGGSREAFIAAASGRHPGVAGVLRYFAWAHLPLALQAVSAPFGLLALELVDALPDSAELTAALRKLLEAKDCAVRAALDREETTS